MPIIRSFLFVAGFVLAFVPLSFGAGVQFTADQVEIITASGKVHFDVELADSDAERELGLMNRPSMPADRGMLFDFKQVAPVSMWMKNTLIPLDMLFVDSSGRIISIGQGKPQSTRLISSGGAVLAVIELNRGTARAKKISVGDRVLHPIFQKSGDERTH